ncbi:hypothetical protein FPZ43_03795 [Mucilaginibacter pallidiroseus]|uniref:Uncharacterized protein n=1 Tax=Mucilaginibacter pallidiroseus TaxID=2599295 RepID=A0A563UJQ5_9SPHI|nr:hypothetical protein [Mucilaginibacter pallidiroseus]TWR31604.1 hypothetical protein FPZ43_03795 [Mucilaginibacter pallidiroseus]
MRPASLLTILGFIILIAGTFCPLLRPLHLFNWNVYGLNQPYGMVLLLVAVIGILSAFLNQVKVARIAAYVSLGLVVLLYIAAIFKIKSAFSFIPFKGINAFMIKQIAFKWGWYVLFAGAAISAIGAAFTKKSSIVISQ